MSTYVIRQYGDRFRVYRKTLFGEKWIDFSQSTVEKAKAAIERDIQDRGVGDVVYTTQANKRSLSAAERASHANEIANMIGRENELLGINKRLVERVASLEVLLDNQTKTTQGYSAALNTTRQELLQSMLRNAIDAPVAKTIIRGKKERK